MKNKFWLAIIVMLFAAFVPSLNCYADVFSQLNYGLNQYDRMMNTADRLNNIKQNYTPATPPSYQQNAQPQYGAQQYSQPTYNYQSQYSQPQSAPIQTPYQFTNTQQYLGAASTLGGLPPGTIVIDPKSLWKYNYKENYVGEPIVEAPVFWKVFANDHFKQGATLLVSDYVVAEYDFNHMNKGMTDWTNSDTRRWLRTTFYKHFSPAFKNAVVNVEVSSVNMKNQPYKSIENVFLLSIVEWGLSDRANNGKVIDYEYLNRDLETGEVGYFKSGAVLTLNKNSALSYGTRTINVPQSGGYVGYRKDVFAISNGLLRAINYNYGFENKIRPAVNIKSSTPVSGPYSMPYHPSKTLTYYVLECPAPPTTAQ